MIRHARASAVAVSVRQDGNRLVLEIRDNGIGLAPGVTGDGFGMRGMRERVERLGGQFSVESDPTGGTIVRVEIPY